MDGMGKHFGQNPTFNGLTPYGGGCVVMLEYSEDMLVVVGDHGLLFLEMGGVCMRVDWKSVECAEGW